MSASSLAEIKSRADIRDVYRALGGAELRGCRGRAFWRDGHDYNVSIDAQRGVWHDFVTGDGGDVVTLVEVARQCSFVEAVAWLAQFVGVAIDGSANSGRATDADWPRDLRMATWWSIAAASEAERALAALPFNDLQRRGLTDLLRTIRLGDLSLVTEYRAWRQREPKLTAAMVRAGRLSRTRLKRRYERWIREKYGTPTS